MTDHDAKKAELRALFENGKGENAGKVEDAEKASVADESKGKETDKVSDTERGKASSTVNRSRAPRPKPVPVGAGNTIYVTGNGVAAGQIAGGDIHNHSYAKPPRAPKVTVKPGDGVITEDQKFAITTAREEWMRLSETLKKKPLSHAATWSKINRFIGVTSYHQIPAERFGDVMGFIKREIAILRSMKSAPSKDKTWRASRITAIKARCNNELGNSEAYKAYIQKNFGVTSLASLSTDELQRTHTYIMRKKKRAEDSPSAR